MNKKAARAHICKWTAENIESGEQAKFTEVAEHELLSLHEGNFARYQIRPSEFVIWQEVWNRRCASRRHGATGKADE